MERIVSDEVVLPAIVDINLQPVTLFIDRLDEIVAIRVGDDERLCLSAGDADVLGVALTRGSGLAGGWETSANMLAAEAEADAEDGE
jgi:hypothetical protein